MSIEHKKQLEQQLWNIANTLRGKMNADEFRDYILVFIFYKYLSEKMNLFADEILAQDNIAYKSIKEDTEKGIEYLIGQFASGAGKKADKFYTPHFEKVKTQNILREDDIDKIIDAYRNRTESEKYSKKATLQEIANNDYNLNIPRYIDTFEAEESIDINALALQLQGLETEITQTNADLAAFCKELNLPNPF